MAQQAAVPLNGDIGHEVIPCPACGAPQARRPQELLRRAEQARRAAADTRRMATALREEARALAAEARERWPDPLVDACSADVAGNDGSRDGPE